MGARLCFIHYAALLLLTRADIAALEGKADYIVHGPPREGDEMNHISEPNAK